MLGEGHRQGKRGDGGAPHGRLPGATTMDRIKEGEGEGESEEGLVALSFNLLIGVGWSELSFFLWVGFV